jgi:hypothetical protein
MGCTRAERFILIDASEDWTGMFAVVGIASSAE